MFDFDTLIYTVPAILISVTLHEMAHGYVSYKMGDPTPKEDGRLSLNPLHHLDFFGTLSLLSSVLAFAGYNLEIAFSSVVACITNSGPGLGAVIGPAGNYSSLSDFAKYDLSFTMLLGRLEIITVIAVFTRSFWFKN